MPEDVNVDGRAPRVVRGDGVWVVFLYSPTCMMSRAVAPLVALAAAAAREAPRRSQGETRRVDAAGRSRRGAVAPRGGRRDERDAPTLNVWQKSAPGRGPMVGFGAGNAVGASTMLLSDDTYEGDVTARSAMMVEGDSPGSKSKRNPSVE